MSVCMLNCLCTFIFVAQTAHNLWPKKNSGDQDRIVSEQEHKAMMIKLHQSSMTLPQLFKLSHLDSTPVPRHVRHHHQLQP